MFGNPSHYGGQPSVFGSGQPTRDAENFDTSETLFITPSALLSMIKHARAGVPLEVMGLMLGKHIDKYTVRLDHVFAMPQSGTGVNVSAIDHAFQVQMTNLLNSIGIDSPCIGWYHSHPGFGCWLSNVDISTHQSFEKLDPRALAVVIDPIQSVKGKVIIDAFRSIDFTNILGMKENRTSSSFAKYESRPTITALLRGLNRVYYSVRIAFKVGKYEANMLERVIKKGWSKRLMVGSFSSFSKNSMDFYEIDSKERKEESFDFEEMKNQKTSRKNYGFGDDGKEENDNSLEFGKEESYKIKLLKKRKGKDFKYMGKIFEVFEKIEMSMKEEEKYLQEFIKNKKRVKASSDEMINKVGKKETLRDIVSKFSKKQWKNMFNKNEKNNKIVGNSDNEKEEEKKILTKEEKESLFSESIKALKVRKVGKKDYLKQLHNVLKIDSEFREKEALEISRMGVIFGIGKSREIYDNIKQSIY